MSLEGKRALVTGASSGLGAHFARVLAEAGAEVVLAARNVARLEALAATIGPAASQVALDVRDPASVADAIAQAGPIDVLVNNAGVTTTAPALDQSEDDWASVVGTNLEGGYRVAVAAARAMREGGRGGSIVNIASILGLRQGGQVTPYAVSKAGVIQMTKQLALELARYDIRVNAIAPGYIETDLNRDFFASPAGEALVKRIPQRRLGQLADLDAPLLLLASSASAFMTGSVIVVDGGHMVSSL
ncbi:SDR family oxidoreductase [Sphingomonas sp. LY54]|uniref:SDR family NAD(P)-dependent oxidoreductase n=1 Tax=Sphingomonas sp. LY54 TaxID=3095343 RepID=UPI002D775B31|nr:SDR family oxidoreductase [Sphingomonas sp. LY54]WRP30259.1 SDR family oxidoreductase [Sphingomonas sp. LY54]